MDVKIISTETIKPSSPIPPHLQTYKICLLDQLFPPTYGAAIYHYRTHQQNLPKISSQLKHSLSQALTLFYPLAGKLKDDDLSVDCGGDGAFYAEARVSCRLDDFLTRPDTGSVRNFLPVEPLWEAPHGGDCGPFAVMIQASFFECGGVAIGVCGLHRVADGGSVLSFVESWSAACRNGSAEITRRPSFSTASALFPQNPALAGVLAGAPSGLQLRSGKSVLRRFGFRKPAVAALRERASAACRGGAWTTRHPPTRVEVVSALLWRCFILAKEAARGGRRRPSIVSHVVDVRGKTTALRPSGGAFGNILWSATARDSGAAGGAEFGALVGAIREGMERVDGRLIRSMEGEEGFGKACEEVSRAREVVSEEGADYLSFASLCNSGIYGMDFGWGKPDWVRIGISAPPSEGVFMNMVYLMETRRGDGVEAWVLLGEEEMGWLEKAEELLAAATVEPSPLSLCE